MNEYLKRIDGLEINTVEDGFIIYQPDKDRVHYLNHTAVFLLELCNGRNSVGDLANLMKKAYHLTDVPDAEIIEILARMKDEGLLE